MVKGRGLWRVADWKGIRRVWGNGWPREGEGSGWNTCSRKERMYVKFPRRKKNTVFGRANIEYYSNQNPFQSVYFTASGLPGPASGLSSQLPF